MSIDFDFSIHLKGGRIVKLKKENEIASEWFQF